MSLLLACTLAVLPHAPVPSPGTHAPQVRVVVLAGQSNMEGKAQNKLWEHQAVDAKTAAFFAPFRDDDNQQWVVRDDVWIKFFGR